MAPPGCSTYRVTLELPTVVTAADLVAPWQFRVGTDKVWHPVGNPGEVHEVVGGPASKTRWTLVFDNVPGHCQNVCLRLTTRRVQRQFLGLLFGRREVDRPKVVAVDQLVFTPLPRGGGGS